MSGMPHAAETGWRTRRDGLAARRVDMDPAGGSDCELGGPSAGAGGVAEFHGGASGNGAGGRYGTERRAAAPADAHLSYGAGRCASDCRVLEVLAGTDALVAADQMRRDRAKRHSGEWRSRGL